MLKKAVVKKILKQYGASIVCLLLAFGVALGGTVSYARYVSGGEFFERPGVGMFAGSGIVSDVSALTFTNLAFWNDPNNTEDAVSMNSLRHITFKLNNGEKRPNGTYEPSHVATEYAVMFSAPTGFATKLALQLRDSTDTALTPQFVLADLLNAVNSSKTDAVFSTANPQFNGKEYLGPDGESFMTFDVHFDTATGTYTATSRGREGTVITIEPVTMKNVSQVLYFRLWDVEGQGKTEAVEEDGGKLMPPMVMEYKADLDCYRITFSRNDFVFPAGVFTERTYALSLAPTDALLDDQLGGYVMQYDSNLQDYVPATTLRANEPVFLSSVVEVAEFSGIDGGREVTLMGNIPKYKVGDVTERDRGTTTREWDILDGITIPGKSETTLLVQPENGMNTVAVTKYYRKSGNRWSNSNQSSGNYSITKQIQKTTSITYHFNFRVREIGKSNETYTVTAILQDGKLIQQSGVRNTNITYEILDVTMGSVTEYKYEIVTFYKYRSSTRTDWANAQTVTESTFSGMSSSMYPGNPTIIERAPEESGYEYMDNQTIESNGKTPLQNFLASAEVQAFLQELQDAAVGTTPAVQNFTRTLTYTARVVEVHPTSITNADETVPTNPFVSHLPSGIQKYYLSTSFSKNYPVFVQMFIRQIQD